jgi:hypothetical protein
MIKKETKLLVETEVQEKPLQNLFSALGTSSLKHISMKPNELLREQIFEILKNQIKDNDPPETKITYTRLKKLGYNDFETKQLIGQCVAVELFQVLKFKEPFDEERYVKNLKNLPKEPFD